MLRNKNNKPAFTLIELLVVIAIIGILATLAVVSLQNARKNARDAKRIADIRQVQTALELYYNDVGEYPAEATSSIAYGSNIYMAVYPTAPTPADGDCADEDNAYIYTQQNLGTSYTIDFCLGTYTGGLTAGSKQATPGGIVTPWDCGETLVDSRDSNEYATVEIGTQCWMAENLAYLPSVTGPSAQWNSTDPRYAVYNYTSASNSVIDAKATTNYSTYGVLYNWFAVDQASICPTGWSVPTDTQLTTLTTYLGGLSVAGGKMKQTGTTHWASPNTGATNESGFTALPAGNRLSDGSFGNLGYVAIFWSSSESSPDNSWYRYLYYYLEGVDHLSNLQTLGLSVRCLKN